MPVYNSSQIIRISNQCVIFRGGYLNNNSIIFIGKEHIYIIDPSYNFAGIKNFLKANKFPKTIIFTHAHSDHIGNDFHEIINYADHIIFSAPVQQLIDQQYFNDLFFGKIEQIPDQALRKIQFVKHLDKYHECTFYLTPGHSIDSMCVIFKTFLITGDLIFHEGIGRTDFPLSDPKIMNSSLQLICELMRENFNFLVIPGHDEYGLAKDILKSNRYLNKILSST